MDISHRPYRFPFWGKTDKKADGEHSHLLQHLLAVGANCHAILLQPAVARVVVEAGRKYDHQRLLPLLIWVAMLHDIGKLLPDFQHKCPWVLKAIGKPEPPLKQGSFSHGDEGYFRLVRNRGEGIGARLESTYNWSEEQYCLVLSLWRGACSHHGHHVRTQHESSLSMRTAENRALFASAYDLSVYLHDLVEHIAGPVFVPEIEHDKALIQNFSGYVAIADWLGSDTEHHPFVAIPEFEDRFLGLDGAAALYRDYLVQAQKRLKTLEFAASANLSDWEAAIFPDLSKDEIGLHPMQEAIREASRTHGAGLYIIEDAMGSGKTEGALLGAHELLKLGLGQGIVFALPSQGSADQTFTRMDAFSRTLFDLEPNLAHANAKFARKRMRASGQEQAGDLSAEHLSEWVTSNNKRAFLAPVCAATIDQIMLAAMDCRHGFVRAAGISRHVVIIDEVHAYDSYMGKILDRLLEMLGASATPVILLSATLPNATRQKYLDAYRRGARPAGYTPAFIAADHYPLLTVCPVNSLPFRQKVASATKNRSVAIQIKDEADIYTRLVSCAQNGCAAIICNSIKSVFRRYEYLRKVTQGSGIEVMLLHARFRLCDRSARARDILQICDKNSRAENRRGKIVVATQVIEQSLDLDFDYLASEIAPIDLLLQRMGRLFRHKRDFRPEGFKTAQFDVVDARHQGKPWDLATEKIYDQPAIMGNTYSWLKTHQAVTLPSEIATVVNTVYDHYVITANENARQSQGSAVAIDFCTVTEDDIAMDVTQSSDTRGSEDGEKFLLVRRGEEGTVLDLIDGTPVCVFDPNRPDEIAAGFLDWANERLVNLRLNRGVGRPAEGNDMLRESERCAWNNVMANRMKYPPFVVVECIDGRSGKLAVVQVTADYQYGELFGLKKG